MSQFIYDNIGFAESTIAAGTVSGTTFTESASLEGTEHYSKDMNLSNAVTSFFTNDTIRFDMGSSQTADVIAFYFTGAETDNIYIYAGSSATAIGTDIKQIYTFTSGWNIIDLSGTGQYWFIRSMTGYISKMTEIIIGTKYTFDVSFDLNNKIGEEFGTDIMVSLGGNEYANKRHDPKTIWNWNWSFISASMKTSLDDLNASVQDYKKFVYYDETNYHYVRMLKPLDFTEVANNVYSTNISLREQLA